MASALPFRPSLGPIDRLTSQMVTYGRVVRARVSTALVGTWSPHQAVFIAVPRDLRTADPTRASELIEGYIALGDQIVELKGRKLFEVASPSLAHARALHSFEWLHHLRTFSLRSTSSMESQRIAARFGRESVLNWIETRRSHPAVAHTPQVTASRALALTNQAAFLLNDSEPADYRAIMGIILSNARQAFTKRSLVVDPTQRLMLLLACASVAFSLQEHVSLKDQTLRALLGWLPHALLADGMPVTRRAGDLPPLLALMLSLRALLDTRAVQTPPILHEAIDASLRMLRMLRHPDGSLARFQGTKSLASVEGDLVAAILSFDTERSALPTLSQPGGIARLELGKSVALMECGPPPPLNASREAHASALAIEWSFAGVRLLTNAPEIGLAVDADIASQRTTAAHSTLVAAGLSSATFSGREADALLAIGGLSVLLARQTDPASSTLRARHTGYKQRLGVEHERTLSLLDEGRTLAGVDKLVLGSGHIESAGRTSFAIHFALPLGARVTQESDTSVRLSVRHISVRLHTNNGTIVLQDPSARTSYRGVPPAPRIVIKSPSKGDADIGWHFKVESTASIEGQGGPDADPTASPA